MHDVKNPERQQIRRHADQNGWDKLPATPRVKNCAAPQAMSDNVHPKSKAISVRYDEANPNPILHTKESSLVNSWVALKKRGRAVLAASGASVPELD